jgi:formylmethanofuran dehydrogenase subunit C
MPLVLSLRTSASIPLEVEAVRIDVLRSLAKDAVSKLPVRQGNHRGELAEFFAVSGSCADGETIVWQGDLSKVKRIGAGQTGGRTIVEGHAGMHLGAEMSGGIIEVRGNAGDWAGAEMRGGRIHIHGSAGDRTGCAYPGGRRGMRGGELLIEGDCGNEIGLVMRRGLIAIGGSAGNFIGGGMIAGTILVYGNAGIRHGSGMKRGTIALLGSARAEILPTFRESGTCNPLFLSLYERRLRALGFGGVRTVHSPLVQYRGDLLELGLGEILMSA